MPSHAFCLLVLSLILRRLLWSRGLISATWSRWALGLTSQMKHDTWYMVKIILMPQAHLLLPLGGTNAVDILKFSWIPKRTLVFEPPLLVASIFCLLPPLSSATHGRDWLILVHMDPIGSFCGFKSECINVLIWSNLRTSDCNSCFFPPFYKSIGPVQGSATNLEFTWFQSQYSILHNSDCI